MFSSEVNKLLGAFVLIVFLMQSPWSISQTAVTGQLVDSIQIGNTAESYAVYLPKAYDETKAASIVFIFKPQGTSQMGLQAFIPAAERYNHILISSNDAKNGTLQTNFVIANRLFKAVFGKYHVDENQIYLAGFSGGARLASTMAVMSNKIQGVIACGAGFLPNSEHQPTFGHDFSYVGLVGTRDMNYQEMLQTQKWLELLKIQNALFINDDYHLWPPASQITKAFSWLELRAYEKNLKPKNFEVLDTIYANLYLDARQNETDGKLNEAVNGYERLVKDFISYYTIDSIQHKLVALRQASSYIKLLATHEKLAKVEKALKNEIDLKFASEINKRDAVPSFKWWDRKLQKIHKDYVASDDQFEKSLGDRLSLSVYALAIETGDIHFRDQNYEKALYCHMLLTIVMPDSAYPLILSAIDTAHLGDAALAVEFLQMAFEKGVADKSAILAYSQFDSIRDSPAFKTLKGK